MHLRKSYFYYEVIIIIAKTNNYYSSLFMHEPLYIYTELNKFVLRVKGGLP